jgi:UDP-N-acetylglucosamine acyltransferase
VTTAVDVSRLVRQIPSRYPFVLVDRVLAHEPSGRLVASKSVTGSEEFFAGHFPNAPVMPGVLLMEGLAQAAGIWILHEAQDAARMEIRVVGIDAAKFRRPVTPGDLLQMDVRLIRRRRGLYRFQGEVRTGDQRVAEARLLLQVAELDPPAVDPTARVAPGAVLGPGVQVGPFCVVGPHVRLGRDTRLHSHVVVDGHTVIGEANQVFPFASIGLAPQDLKYRGEPSRLEIGDRNIFREFVTVHRGTEGGGGVTRIGSDNLFMAECHVAHDCRVGDHTIFGNAATLAGHVEVQSWANVSAFSGVHQFCRVGQHAFVGGFTVATKDVLPYSKTVGNRARLFGINSVGLARRGFSPAVVRDIRRAFRALTHRRLNVSQALEHLEREGPSGPEVQVLLDFIRSSARGVVLRRRRRTGEEPED